MSFIEPETININEKTYHCLDLNMRFKTLGSLMNHVTLIVNENVYEELSKIGQQHHFYGVKVENDEILTDENTLMRIADEMAPYVTENMNGQIGAYEVQKIEWMKAVYAVGAFLFLVFILADRKSVV